MGTEVNTNKMADISDTTTTPDAPEVAVDPMVRQLNLMSELLDTLSKTSKSLTLEMKTLTRDINKMKLASSKGKRAKRVVDPNVPRKLGALEKPVPITEELAEFLGLAKGELFSRQFITQNINKFVKDKELQNPENKRYILLESEEGLKLKALLRDPDQPLTFFNIQRYLKVHYPKVEAVVEEGADNTATATKKKTLDIDSTKTTEKSKVVADADVVDETAEPPKKKVVRKVVKKSGAVTA